MQSDFVKPLLLWYNAAKRDLPWRHTDDPYAIYVSEIMLQQTRVEAVLGYYARFLDALPDPARLSVCPDDVLFKLWEGLGYYSRARHMKKTAQILMEEHGGRFPGTKNELLKLPGIGSYTASAIASIAFGEKTAAVDGNVLRVYARLQAFRDNILRDAVKKQVEAELTETMAVLPDAGDVSATGTHPAGDFNQAMIELGALVCLPRGEARCGSCPISRFCQAKVQGLVEELPLRLAPQKRREEKLTVFLIRDGDEVAIRKRPEKGLLSGLYEFPNTEGFLTAEEAVRFVEAEGFEALKVRKLRDARHLFTHVTWLMEGYEIRVSPGSVRRGDCLFVRPDELKRDYALPSAFSAYAELLINE